MAEEFIVTGKNLVRIPSNAVGIIAYSNATPLQYLNDQGDTHLYSITAKADFTMRLSRKRVEVIAANAYLGAIVSSDRQTIYWENDTKPLP